MKAKVKETLPFDVPGTGLACIYVIDYYYYCNNTY